MTDARSGGADVERYEQLRSRALGGEPAGFRLGLALLERRGMAAWARAWDTTAPARGAPTSETPTVPGRVPVGDELVGALASMALARVAAG
jgi:hypothetical protein